MEESVVVYGMGVNQYHGTAMKEDQEFMVGMYNTRADGYHSHSITTGLSKDGRWVVALGLSACFEYINLPGIARRCYIIEGRIEITKTNMNRQASEQHQATYSPTHYHQTPSTSPLLLKPIRISEGVQSI
jgi:hypothetical protein